MREEGPKVSLHLGNFLEILPTLDRTTINVVITDPPYGIAHKSNGQRFKSADPIEGDSSIGVAMDVANWASGIPLAMFFSPYRSLPIKWRSVLCWSKGEHVGIGGDRATCWKRDFELIGIRDNRKLNGQRDSAVLQINAVSPPPSGHFCEKPVRLMVYLIKKLTRPGDTVFDPCMGSGSTGVACIRTGRNFIGIEIDPKYYSIARDRIEAEQAKMSLFESSHNNTSLLQSSFLG